MNNKNNYMSIKNDIFETFNQKQYENSLRYNKWNNNNIYLNSLSRKLYFIPIIFGLIINFIFLSFNIYFSLKNKNKYLLKHKNNIIFNNLKNVDFFLINIILKPFSKISLYLNSKYKIKNNILQNNIIDENRGEKLNNKKIITINFVGSFNLPHQKVFMKGVLEGLNEKFNFQINYDNPDYLIYDVFNCDFLENKYKNSIKIAFYTENEIPDFNEADYAIGFHNINYLDRYFKKTTLIWVFQRRYLNIKNKDFMSQRKKVLKGNIRKKFCAAVISNIRSSDKFRIKFIFFYIL